MFEKFENVKSKSIIGNANNLTITPYGLIMTEDGNLVPTEKDSNDNVIVDINFLGRYDKFRVVDLVAIHFKGFDRTGIDLSQIEGFHLDGDKSNNHASNVGYRFKSFPLESVSFKNYFHIPGQPNYLINPDQPDHVIYGLTGTKYYFRVAKAQKDNVKNITGGYLTTVVNDVYLGRISVSRHRAMLLAFTHVPDNIETLVCNHINGKPGDDRLENLEWVTRKRNLAHAYETGLRSQNRPVLLKHVITGEILEFFSVAEAGRKIGCNDRGLNHMLEYRPFGSVNAKGYQIKYKDDTRDWVIFDNPEEMVKLAIQKIGVKARNCSTLEISEFKSIGKASEYTGVKQATIGYRFSKEDYSPLRNWQFIPDYLDEFPDFTEEERLATLSPINFKVIARNLNTGEIRNFDSVKKAGKSGIGIQNIADRIRKGQQPIVDNIWQFKLDDGSDWQEPKKDWFARSQPCAVYALDIKTGTIHVHNTIAELSRVLNVNKSTVANKCDTGKLVENRYIFTRDKPATL